MLQTRVQTRSRGGLRTPWKDDPETIREYLRIYREVRLDGLPVSVVARDHQCHRTHIYWIIERVEEAVRSGILAI